MRTTLAILATLALVLLFAPSGATAQQIYPDVIVLTDTCTTCAPIAADSTTRAVDTRFAEYAVVQVWLDSLGGSGTYGIDVLTSFDGTVWDTLRIDTLVAASTKITYALAHSHGVVRGPGATTTDGIALSGYLKVRIDEIAASSGSDLLTKVFLWNRKYVRQVADTSSDFLNQEFPQ